MNSDGTNPAGHGEEGQHEPEFELGSWTSEGGFNRDENSTWRKKQVTVLRKRFNQSMRSKGL